MNVILKKERFKIPGGPAVLLRHELRLKQCAGAQKPHGRAIAAARPSR
jgi:hypothetical protein